MPELPEVETICRGLRPALEGKRLIRVQIRRPDLRIPFPPHFAERLQGRVVVAVERRAKYILGHLDNETILLAHLGMAGRITVEACPGRALEAHDHVAIETDGGQRIVLRDHRRFGLMTLLAKKDIATHPLLARLGMEPLSSGLTAANLRKQFHGRRAPLKAALLDQRIVAGLGNIYVCEALFHARLSPQRKAGEISLKEAERLSAAIRDVLQAAIEAGGSSLRDYVHADGALGYFQTRFSVYDREGVACARGCGKNIRRIVQSGRSTFYCPSCQR